MEQLVHRAGDGSLSEFVALDVGNLSVVAGDSSESNQQPFGGSLSKKDLERRGEEEMMTSTGVFGQQEKQSILAQVAVDGSPRGREQQFHATTPTGNKRRRGLGGGSNSRRTPPWRDPRKVLLIFAALSSIGTLILLYFTLSMGKMAGDEADGRR